jgi:hypothetical protein
VQATEFFRQLLRIHCPAGNLQRDGFRNCQVHVAGAAWSKTTGESGRGIRPPSERDTNAYTECLNGIAKITNRHGRGYSFDVIRFKLLFGHSHQKRFQPSMKAELMNLGVPFSTFDEKFDDE